MKSLERTYWVDLSDLSGWNGHYTGIQRVVFNLAKYYAERSDVKFFVFDKPITGFFEVDFNIIEAPTEVVEEISDNVSKPAGPNIVRRFVHAVPGRYKQRVPHSAKMLLRTGYKTLRAISNGSLLGTQAQNHRRLNLTKPAVFTSSDVVLVLGSPWANPDMMPSLVNVKLQADFRLVQVIYDLIPILMPYLFGEKLFPEFTRYLFDVVANSDGLVAISRSSKKDVEAFSDNLLVAKKPVGVMRLGDEFVKSVAAKPKIDVASNKFILCVGTFEIRKNHQLLYYVYKEAKRRGIMLPKLVIVGRQGWLTSDLEYAMKNDLDVKESIIILHNASDSNLSWLYENCRFTVYPAVYEGWGLPIAESLAYGKLCIASDSSSMTEIAPKLVEHVSPYDTSAWLNLLEKYSADDQALGRKQQSIRQEYGEHSWEDTYKQFDQFVKDLFKKNTN